ncbi:MAG: hypothetical protein AAFY81_09655, partial [Pseudomonadota bacterium]
KVVRASLLRALLLDHIEGITADPKGLQLAGARITEQLDLEACNVPVSIGLFSCLFAEDVVLVDTNIAALYLSGSHLQQIDAERLLCHGPVHLRSGFQVANGANFRRARISGALECDGGIFNNTDGIALDCHATRIGADVFLREGFTSEGEVNLVGAEIIGQLDCTDGAFKSTKGFALNCDAARIGADVFLCNEFLSAGEVILRRAAITGQLNCTGGTFLNADGCALNCDAVQIGADVFLRDGFSAEGIVDFERARVEGNLQIGRAQLTGAVGIAAARIGEGLFLRELGGEVSMMDLKDTSAGVLRDDRESWKHVDSYRLQGFRYDRVDSNMRVHERIAWLEGKDDAPLPGHEARNDPPRQFAPQPYTWLASVLQKEGRRQGAVEVRFEREARLAQVAYDRVRHERPVEPWHDLRLALAAIRFGASKLSRLVFGYGYKPIRALWTVADAI